MIYNGGPMFVGSLGAVMSSSSYFSYAACTDWVKPTDHMVAKKGVVMNTLYDVFLVYGEDRIDPVLETKRVVAANPEEAKLKSKISAFIKDEWDMDFVTIVVNPIGQVAIKERPTEVKSV